MSIKSEISRINTVVSTQADLLTQIRSVVDNLPDAGSGGSGGGGATLETCDLTITSDVNGCLEIGYTTLENGAMKANIYMSEYTPHVTVTLNNVVCNTALTLRENYTSGMQLSVTTSDNVSLVEAQVNGDYVFLYVFECIGSGVGTIDMVYDTGGFGY